MPLVVVDKIIIYENGIIEVKLKADIDHLLQVGELPGEEVTVNFNFDSMDISTLSAIYSPNIRNQRGKVYTVNIISEGDPLEIYTSRDGEVIFKKYSLLGGVEEFAAQLCETLSKSSGFICAVTDRDTVVSVAGGGRRELLGKRITPDLEQIMESRKIYQRQADAPALPVVDGCDRLLTAVAAPISSEGDLLGLVLMIGQDPMPPTGDTEYKLAQTISAFLGRHMEN